MGQLWVGCHSWAMLRHIAQPQKYGADTQQLFSLLKGEGQSSVIFKNHFTKKTGTVTGSFTGGNLTMFCNSIGTTDVYLPKGSILFLEEISEPLYHVDRMLWQLRRAGVFNRISGLVLGHFTHIKDEEPCMPYSLQKAIEEVTADLDILIADGLPAGHDTPNTPFVVGGSYTLTVQAGGECAILLNSINT